MNADLKPLTSFILPGGTPLAAHLHLARILAARGDAAGAQQRYARYRELGGREPLLAPAGQ